MNRYWLPLFVMLLVHGASSQALAAEQANTIETNEQVHQIMLMAHKGKGVVIVQTLRSDKPVFFRRDNDEIFYVRAGNGTQELKPSEILAYIDQRQSQI